MTDKLKLLDDLLLGAPWTDEEAIIIIALRREVLAEKSLAESIQAAKRLAEPELPPMVPINGKTGVRVQSGKRAAENSPLNVSCPRCKAKAGKPCFKFDAPGKHGKVTGETLKSGYYHQQRTEKVREQVT